MNIEQFIQSTEALHSRLADLYQTASVLPWIPPELLPQAFKELYSSSKMVQLAAEELYRQNEELIQTRNWLEAERQRYRDLFEFAPDGYLVTNTEGIIQDANVAAAQLLNLSRQLLLGKPIVNFVRLEERQPFRSEIYQLCQSDRVKELVLPLQKNHGEYFDAALTVAVLRNQQGQANSLGWLLRNINETEKNKTQLANGNINIDLVQDRPVHKHTKGETIPLNPLVVWHVRQGLVKLNTFCETGEEILIGLATQDMVFGSNMTSLPIYQATALSDVELTSIYLAEIAVNPMLSHILLPKINQRLQQTESFLVIVGKRRVEERLYHLLQLLKQQIGEPVPEGTRLSVRLTHEDIASACCTTRVTITRLMGKLQQEGLITFDAKKYIILKN
ncbi:helix-turn-helix domain-containing protein [Umezakia ovalisporum]|uniref:Helix-turn-helix domain-containing protein n=1 Tax=Umezakia ovalisporum FSS-43 TaxID=2740520 RepID=A0ABT6K1M1_9CYAN|nr:helix-turn-helix domain-containing protein [Umezakia ovalisporum]MDH6056252.1 helix-turn-helix domain-containing protein [Umezakia ovalisporum FSS-43]MDH6067792.1 helix-turn-helix domain-containing protein [Umezakia ovalisporum APH033B]MDH6070900.1 helix-turn-helix domain-containing protein [Umezakia ovalisporum CobakiLakeA]MDH6074503.1 helix-turn-helix domain-containing protein [Umezakia ovalisporum CS-1034]MDH6079136.1 helix-turn-helix domain-containing protein [Umezakia ovalisporum FSS-4